MAQARTSPLLESIGLLTEMRNELGDLLPTINWMTRCQQTPIPD